jgi:hypothetical protein
MSPIGSGVVLDALGIRFLRRRRIFFFAQPIDYGENIELVGNLGFQYGRIRL